MKYYLFFLIFSFSQGMTFGTYNKLQYNHTIYYYNSSNCDNIPYKIESIKMPNCYIYNKNMCLNYTNSSSFNTCKLIIYDRSYIGSTIILTLLITILLFLLYKLCCQNFLDNLCICLRDSLYNLLCPSERPDYSSL